MEKDVEHTALDKRHGRGAMHSIIHAEYPNDAVLAHHDGSPPWIEFRKGRY